MSASFLASGDGGNSRAKGVAPHGGGPASRVDAKDDARSGANFHEECEVARRTGNVTRTSAPGTYAQAAAQPLSSSGENRSWRSRKQETGRIPAQVSSVGLSGLDAGGRGSLPGHPRSVAVLVTVPENAGITYAQAMTRVRMEVNLDELLITDIRPRMADTGALILEIACREVGHEQRMNGLEDSATLDEVVDAVSEAGGCSAGVLRFAARGFGSVWLRCPLAADRKIIMEGGRPKVRWVRVKVRPIPARGTQRYRCLETGHARRDRNSEIDRSDRCYRCGSHGACKAEQKSP
jgi:hypothetical protein